MGIAFQFGEMKKFWRWLHSNVNIFNDTELYTENGQDSFMLYIFHHNLKFFNTSVVPTA